MTKHSDQKQHADERAYLGYTPGSPSIIEERQGRNWSRHSGEILPTCLLSGYLPGSQNSASFLNQFGATAGNQDNTPDTVTG